MCSELEIEAFTSSLDRREAFNACLQMETFIAGGGTGDLGFEPATRTEGDSALNELLASQMPAQSANACIDRGQALVALMAGVQLRDTRAFAELHESCAGTVRTVVIRFVRDHSLADEVVADCFWQIWRDAYRFDAQRGSVSSWIRMIAQSRALDALRRHHAYARRETPLDEVPANAETTLDSSYEQVAVRQRDSILRHLLSRVDPVQRQMLVLAFVCGLSHPEISAHCHIALGTVKSHIRRGLAALRSTCVAAGVTA